MRLSIRSKLLLTTVVPLSLIAGMWVWVTFDRQRTEAVEQMKRTLVRKAEYLASRLDGQFAALAQIPRTTAAILQQHGDVSEAELYDLVRLNVGLHPLVYGSCVAFEPGTVPGRRLLAPYAYRGARAKAGAGASDIAIMDVAHAYDYTQPRWTWFDVPRKTGASTWTEPFFDEGAGNIVMCTFSAPIIRDGAFRGVVTIDVSVRDLERLVEEVGPFATDTKAVGLLSRTGSLIAWPGQTPQPGDTIFSVAERERSEDLAEIGRRAVAGERSTMTVRDSVTGEWMLVSFAPIPSTKWAYVAAASEAAIMAPVFEELRASAIAAVVVVAVAALVVGLAGVRIAKPIEQLAAATRHIGGEQGLRASVDIRRTDELGELARSFNAMLTRLREYIDALQKETAASEAVQTELRVAREIQASLLPRTFPEVAGRESISMHAVNVPARGVAGDFYDFFVTPDGSLGIVIADVSGKGVPAAMFMAVARTVVRDLAFERSDPGDVLTEANRLLMRDNGRGLFVTLMLVLYDPRSGRVRYANAGHLRPYRIAPGRTPSPFGSLTGTVLGVLEDGAWTTQEEQLAPGESMVMYTDGVTDARRNGEMFGDDRLRSLVGELAGVDAESACATMVRRLDEYQGDDRADDITILVLRRLW